MENDKGVLGVCAIDSFDSLLFDSQLFDCSVRLVLNSGAKTFQNISNTKGPLRAESYFQAPKPALKVCCREVHHWRAG